MESHESVAVLKEMLNWIRAGSFRSVKSLLEEALPDDKSRKAFQLLDGPRSTEQVRIACKMSPNVLVALTQRCISMGLMEIREDKKRSRLFDLTDFGMATHTGEANDAK
jgi:hypothetical protein